MFGLATAKTDVDIRVRVMKRCHLEEACAIEYVCFPHPWTEKDFAFALRANSCDALIVESDGCMVGFIVFEWYRRRLDLLNLAVTSPHQRNGIGRHLIDRMKSNMSPEGICRIFTEVRESNLGAQQFFRAMGFRCIQTLSGYYEESEEDAYRFVYALPF